VQGVEGFTALVQLKKEAQKDVAMDALQACMYLSVCVCANQKGGAERCAIHTCIHLHIYTYVYVHVYIYVGIIYTYISIYIHCNSSSASLSICLYTRVRVYACACVCLRVCKVATDTRQAAL